MEAKHSKFLPFHAINEFMRDDFRLVVMRSVLANSNLLPSKLHEDLNRLIRKVVKVPGFRNSEKAPATIKLLPMVSAFQKNPELVAIVLTAWAEIHHELRDQVYEVLKIRNWIIIPEEFHDNIKIELPDSTQDWGILPVSADRSKLPGFITVWPEGQDYENIYQTFVDHFPKTDVSIDKVSLMAIWLAMRLPYEISGKESPYST